MTRAWVLPVLALLGLAACDKVPLTSPTGSTITLSVSQTTVPVNGTIEVTAAVVEAGGTAVHDGTSVTFTGGLGVFSPIEAETVGGIARSLFRGTTSGTVKIGAFSGAAKATEVEVKVGAAAAGSVSLQVVPPSVGQNGGSVSVTALVLDSNGNALPGVPVVFSTDFGTLSNANVISDVNGYANTNLITTRQAKVTARAGTATPVEFTVNVSAAPTVTLAATPASPIAGQPVAITVTPSNAAGATQLQSVLVDFGDGQTATLGAITGPTGLTHVYNTAGGYTITARATDINGSVGISSTAIVVAFPALPSVSLTVAVNPVPATSNGFATITVTATAATGGAPLRSVVVRKSDGTVIYSGSASGSSTFSYQFNAGSGANPITATVTDAAGISASTTTVVLVQ
jgi:adhesin/invasin